MKVFLKNASSKKPSPSKVEPSVLEYTWQIPKYERIRKTPKGGDTVAGKRREGEGQKKEWVEDGEHWCVINGKTSKDNVKNGSLISHSCE